MTMLHRFERFHSIRGGNIINNNSLYIGKIRKFLSSKHAANFEDEVPETKNSRPERISKLKIFIDNQQFKAIGKSCLWAVAGIILASVIPSTTHVSVSIFGLSYLATRAAQPLVNTKLAVQREKVEYSAYTKLEKTDWSIMKHSKYLCHFFYNEGQLFYNKFSTIGTGKNSHAGGNTYALRGAFAKMVTFAGFEVIFDVLSPVMILHGIPNVLCVPLCGFISGSLQGIFISIPEYFSTLQSRFPGKSNNQLFRDMLTFTKSSWGLPILWVSLRNGVFDMIFNSLRIEFDAPFGLSAVTAMTINYPIERFRSLTHQHEIMSIKDSKFTAAVFQGWLSKAIEFFSVYQLLQILRDIR